jgi:sugar/nucleoside kinase (ribokinase family)
MLEEMRRRSVDVGNVIVIPGGSTGLSVILNREADRAILTYPGLIPSLRAEDLSDELMARARHLHVASYFLQTDLQPGLPGLFHRAHTLGLTTSLDTNWDPSGEWRGFDALLPLVDVFLPNANEARALTGSTNEQQAIAELGRACHTVAVKLGANGGLAFQDGRTVAAPALLVRVVDTVGAGDTFDAGFLYGFLNRWPLGKSLRMACACGSLSTRESGGIAGQPTLEEALSTFR